ncbi:glycosyltransferase [Bauldia litoralis]|uniref:Glycosyltransferase like family 2 n=1 Tax=Bauldia litoralis TaxID=665467 RepID=A0A1G6C818_9HYPH|nr:glycosyltransferase [Bauldia litoralis]SDB28954.1 Glycosyltransferase like family 2 [Bauldia litoralis]
MITVILPTRDDEIALALALTPLVPAAVEGIVREVIVVDAGSRDGTLVVADAAGCTVVRGSGPEALMAAVEEAKSDWLLFLSPSAVLDANWFGEVLPFIDRAMMAGEGSDAAAAFRHGRAESGFTARFAEWSATFRSAGFAAPYQEQGLLVSRSLYRAVGGHRTLPAMADVDLARRIGRRRLTLFRARAVMRRPAGGGFFRGARNAACLAMFVMRLPPRVIGRFAA